MNSYYGGGAPQHQNQHHSSALHGGSGGILHGGGASGGVQQLHHNHGVPVQLMSSDYIDEETAAFEVIYSYGYRPQQYVLSQSLNATILRSPVYIQLQEIIVGLEQLISDQEDFDSWSNAIKDRLAMMEDSQRQLAFRIILEMVVSSAPASEKNTTAGAAQLFPPFATRNSPVHVLARMLQLAFNEINNAACRAILPVLQQFHMNRTAYQVGSPERSALVKFFAECFERLGTRKGAKVEHLGAAVAEQAKELLTPEGMCDDRMKVLLTTVKLAGPALDAMPSLRSKNDELLTSMLAFGKGHPKLSEGMKSAVAALIEKRESGWRSNRFHNVSSSGQLSAVGASSSSSSSSAPAGAIIGTDGRAIPLSEEERTFLEEQMGELDDIYAEMDKFVSEEFDKDEQNKREQMLKKLKQHTTQEHGGGKKRGDRPPPNHHVPHPEGAIKVLRDALERKKMELENTKVALEWQLQKINLLTLSEAQLRATNAELDRELGDTKSACEGERQKNAETNEAIAIADRKIKSLQKELGVCRNQLQQSEQVGRSVSEALIRRLRAAEDEANDLSTCKICNEQFNYRNRKRVSCHSCGNLACAWCHDQIYAVEDSDYPCPYCRSPHFGCPPRTILR